MMDLIPTFSAKVLQTADDNEIFFERKPYKKKIKHVASPASPDLHIPLTPRLKLPQIPEQKLPQPFRQRTILDSKLSELIDFGFDPKVPKSHRELIKYKKIKDSSIKMTDFIKKSYQKQILSTHHLPESFESCEKCENANKEKVPGTFSFSSLSKDEIVSVRDTKSFLLLPPIVAKDAEGFMHYGCKGNREENLKRIDKILESCNEMLDGGKRKGKKMMTQITKYSEELELFRKTSM